MRAGWPAQAVLDNLRLMLAGKQPYDDRGDHACMRGNLSIMPPVHGIESVGAIEAIDSMLLQSQGGVIRVFPNWPAGRDAAFQDLLAEGAFRISATCDHGTIGPIELVSDAGGRCLLAVPWVGRTPSVTEVGATDPVVPAVIAGGRLGFDTVRGKRYRIAPAAAGKGG